MCLDPQTVSRAQTFRQHIQGPVDREIGLAGGKSLVNFVAAWEQLVSHVVKQYVSHESFSQDRSLESIFKRSRCAHSTDIFAGWKLSVDIFHAWCMDSSWFVGRECASCKDSR